ncbi:MAG: DEAD/DEAH box helicase [Thermoplasmata archaeon]
MKNSALFPTIKLRPSYIEGMGNYRKFQEDMKGILNQNKRVVILDAPTGSGKTFAFSKLANDMQTTIIVLPNNLLGKEVYDSLNSSNPNEVVFLNAKNVRECVLSYKSKGFSMTKAKAIELLISGKKYVVTNPTIMYYIILNYYTSNKEDMISTLIKNNLSLIIYDEIHIYTRDQIAMILSMCLLFPEKIKILFSSATIQENFKNLVNEIFGKDNVETIKVPRMHNNNNEKNVLIQGPINVTIFQGEITDFIKENIDLIKNGKWFIIADSIKNMHMAKKELLNNNFSINEISMISAYDDPSYEEYEKIRKKEIENKKIIIGSNIVEQGINPPNYFTNYIIEPGVYLNNFIQRTGRIGRGQNNESNLYIIVNSHIDTIPDNIENIDDLYSFFKNFNFKNDYYIDAFSVGCYLGILLCKLSFNARKVIIKNIYKKTTLDIKAGLSCSIKIDVLFSDKKWIGTQFKYIREIKEMSEWWITYKESFYKFIPEEDKISILDIGDQDGFGNVNTEYSKIWLKRNKEIISDSDPKFWVVKDFNKEPNNNFSVSVYGIPFSKSYLPYKFGDIYFNAKDEIIKNCEEKIKYIGISKEQKEFLNYLAKFIKSTASIERLKVDINENP